MRLFGLEMWPNLDLSSTDFEHSINIHHASSLPKTFSIILTMALTGVPYVMAYMVNIYWIFRRQVRFSIVSYRETKEGCRTAFSTAFWKLKIRRIRQGDPLPKLTGRREIWFDAHSCAT